METNDIQLHLEEINKKLTFIIEEVEVQKKHRQEIDDLKSDLMRVAKEVYSSSLLELEEVSDYLKTGDILYFFKKLFRNINNFSTIIGQLENLRDFTRDFGFVSKELSSEIINKLDEYDRKGYFAFFKEALKIIDNIVTSFTVEDVKALSDNIVKILNTVKNLTQPDMLDSVNNALSVYKMLDIKIEENVSLIQLIKELNKPETKKALYFGILFLKSLSKINNNININNKT